MCPPNPFALCPQVECKKAVPKEEQGSSSPPSSNEGSGAQRTKKIFVGGLAPAVDDKMLRQHFEQFGTVEDAVVMYDHDNKRPRGFGFVTFASEESVDKVFGRGQMQVCSANLFKNAAMQVPQALCLRSVSLSAPYDPWTAVLTAIATASFRTQP